MANDSRPGRKIKDDENNTSQKKLVNGKGTSTLGSATTNTVGLRRSTRESPSSRKQTTSSPSSNNRKSERLEKRVPTTPPVTKKSERVENQATPTPLRRSDRGKKQGSSNSLGSKKSEEGNGISDVKTKKGDVMKIVKRLPLESLEVKKSEGDGEPIVGRKRKRMDGRTYKALFKAQRRRNTAADDDDGDDVEQPSKLYEVDVSSGGTSGAEEVDECSEQIGEELIEESVKKALEGALRRSESSLRNSNKETVVHNVEVELSFSSWKHNELSDGDGVKTTKSDIGKNTLDDVEPVPFDCSVSEDRGELEAAGATGLDEQCDSIIQGNKTPLDCQTNVNETTCVICKLGGNLKCCDGKGCKRSYHLSCLDPSLHDAPLGIWHCNQCVMKKIEKGVHSVSKGVESIWDFREVKVSDVEGCQMQKQYFVKYEGLAHIHNNWIPESQLLLEAPLLVTNYKLKDQAVKWNADWTVPHRLLKKRRTALEKRNEHLNEHGGESLSCHYEWLVKWRGLDYEHATWELENASFLLSTHGQKLVKEYENRLQRALEAAVSVDKSKMEPLVKLSKLPAGTQPGIDNYNVNIVNKLREYWHKGQSAVVFDERERAMKIILYILSLSNVSHPFLITTTSNSLSHWEAEFSRLAPSIDVLVYSGNKDTRKGIRTLEFCEEGDCIMFQVLLSSMEAVVEDLQMLQSLKWEAIIVDECQYPRISRHFAQIKNLATDSNVLIFSAPIKETITEYQNLLSFLDFRVDSANNDVSKIESDDNLGKLKERVTEYIAYKCKFSKFVEYWLPVQISNLQLEQYCATLLSNSIALSSCSKNDPVGALRDTLISSRKCCGHPYLVDPSIQLSITKDLQLVEYLDVGIKASGKLQLLDVILSELKNRRLRVLILFQCIGGSGRDSIGDILDDFLRQRFGQDSYERVDAWLDTSKKQAATNKFNKESSRFVFLLENRACHSKIKLCSVDTIVIFDSDFNPSNDLRALHKISIDSQFEQIKIFRLYSSCTVEERTLILAKQNLALDINIQTLSRSTSDTLLMWGASYLFAALDEFYSSNVADISSEPSILNNVVKEFVDLLSQNDETDEPINPMIVKVQHASAGYSTSLSLLGELKIQLADRDQPHVFWTKLLEGRNPRWKFLSAQNQRQRKRVQHFSDLPPEKRGGENDVGKKRKKVVSHVKPVLEGTNVDNGSHSFPKSVATFTDTLDVGPPSKPTFSDDRPLSDSQKCLHLLPKPDLLRLCEILKLSEDVKVMVGRFLVYVVENHHVSREPESIFQAFQISMCWIAASLLKHKIDRKESLALAKDHLQFICKEEEAESVYSKLRLLKKDFVSKDPKLTTEEDITKQASNAQVLQSQLFIPNNVKRELVERSQVEMLSDLIKPIERKCEKRMAKLLHKQEDEIREFHKSWDDKRLDLENKHKLEAAVVRTIHHRNVSGLLDKLRGLDEELEMKMEEHQRQKETCLKNLEAKHLREMDDEREKAANWLAKAKSSASGAVDNVEEISPPGTTENVPEDDEIGTANALPNQIPRDNEVDKVVSTSLPCSDKEIPCKSISSVRCEDISSELPETVLHEPVETATLDVELNRETAIDEANSSNNADSPSLVDLPLAEPVISLASEGPLSQDLECQNERSQPLDSTELRDGSAASVQAKQSSVTPVEIPPSRNVDAGPISQPEPPIIEPLEPPSTTPPIGHNPPNLPPAYGPTPELQRRTPSQNVVNLSPASGPTTGLQGPTNSQNAAELPQASGPAPEIQPPTPPENVANVPPASGSTAELQGPTPSQNVAHLSPTSGPPICGPSHNVVDLPPASGPTPTRSADEEPTNEIRGTNHPRLQSEHPAAPRVASLPLYVDPLQNELDRIRRDTELMIKSLEDTKSKLKFECEKEIEDMIAQIRRKYEVKLQDAEVAFLVKKNELDTNQNKVLMNKVLAEAFRLKCLDVTPTPVNIQQQAMPSGFMQQLRQFAVPSAPRVSPATSSSAGPPVATQLAIPSAPRFSAGPPAATQLAVQSAPWASGFTSSSVGPPAATQLAIPSAPRLSGVNSSSAGCPPAATQLAVPSAPRVSGVPSSFAGAPAVTQLAVPSAPRASGVTGSSVGPPAANQLPFQYAPQVSGVNSSSAGPPAATQLAVPSAPRVLGVTSSSVGPPAAPRQIPVPPLQIVNQSAALFSSVPTRPLTITPFTPSAGNHRAGGGEIRAPAPHLQPFRPPPVSAPNVTTLIRAMPGPHTPSTVTATSTSFTHPTPRPPPPPPPSAPAQPLVAQPPSQLETPHNTSLSALELLMDIEGRPNEYNPNFLPPLPDFDSNFAPLDLSEFGPPFTTQVSSTPPAVATDNIVCLLDED